jgi:Tfp pilus assembly major pilin PilA
VENPPVVTEDLLLAAANTIKRSHNELKQVVASHDEECRTALDEISRRLDETATRAEELHRQYAEAKVAIDRVEVTAKVAKEASTAAAAEVAKGCAAAQELTRRVAGLVSKLDPEPAADADSTAVATPAAADSGSSTIANVNLPGQARGTPAENNTPTGRSATSLPETAPVSHKRKVDETSGPESPRPKRAAGSGTRGSAHVAVGHKADTTTRASHWHRTVMDNWTME